MKKVLLSIAAAILFAFTMVSCNSNSPKGTAEKFLNSFYHMEYKEAKEVSTEDTKKMLDMIEQFSAISIADSNKQNAKKVKIEIGEVVENGDSATVMYTTSDNKQPQKVNLVKQNGKWLVQWSKEDSMGDDSQNADPAEETMSDSTAVSTEGNTEDTGNKK